MSDLLLTYAENYAILKIPKGKQNRQKEVIECLVWIEQAPEDWAPVQVWAVVAAWKRTDAAQARENRCVRDTTDSAVDLDVAWDMAADKIDSALYSLCDFIHSNGPP